MAIIPTIVSTTLIKSITQNYVPYPDSHIFDINLRLKCLDFYSFFTEVFNICFILHFTHFERVEDIETYNITSTTTVS